MVSFIAHAPFESSPGYEIASTAVAIFDCRELGNGIEPYWSSPTWPGPIAACRKAFTAVPVAESGYLEQTTS
jgi:hypothetical protein